MKYKFRLLFATAIIFSLLSCAGSKKSSINDDISIQELIKSYPAGNGVKGKLLSKALLEFGVSGLSEAAKGLDAADWTTKNQCKYALNGVANYISKYGNRQNRQNLIEVVLTYLKADHSMENKRFMIRQLLPVAGDDLVGKLNSYLTDADLFDFVVEVYRQIDSDLAAKALASYLNAEKNSDKEKIACIKTIGELKYKAAANKILTFADTKNNGVKDAVLFSLANMGYMPAKNLYLNEIKSRNNVYDKELIASEYLRLTENLSYKDAKLILGEIIENNLGYFNVNHKLSAIAIMVKNEGANINPFLLSLFINDDVEYREGILKIAEKLKGSDVTSAWISEAEEAAEHQKGEIIAMLGRRGDKAAASIAEKGLNDSSAEVIIASIPAVFRLEKDKAAQLMVPLLSKTDDDAVISATMVWLNTLPNNVLYPVLSKNMVQFTPSIQVAILETMAKRDARDMQNLVLKQLKSNELKVRIAALKSLKKIGTADNMDLVLDYLLKTSDSKEKREARSLFILLAKKADKSDVVRKVINVYSDKETSENIESIFYILRNLGGEVSLSFIVEKASSKNAEVKDLALRSLFEWADAAAIDHLIAIVKTSKDEQYRVLSVRSVLRLLRENSLGDLTELTYYNDLLASTKDADMRKQIIADIANLKTVNALNYVAGRIDNTELGLTASTTAIRIASTEEGKESLKGEEIAFAIIEANAGDKLKEALHQYRRESEELRETPDGFTALFNGKNLNGWKGLVANPYKRAAMSADELEKAQTEADKLMRKHWTVIDGVLYFDGEGSHLCTQKDYRDFELFVDWKIEKHGDSGLYLRGTPQIQIWDPSNEEQRSVGSGGLYNNKIHENNPLRNADNPVGEWNTFHIIMRGERVTVYLNDVIIVDNVVMENYWERDKPIYPVEQIELQSHHTPLYFKNIFIKELVPQGPRFNGSLFNGKNLNGWEIVGNGKWDVVDGLLTTSGSGGGWISTIRQFSDFKLDLEFRLPENGNSGVFIRTLREGNPAYAGMEIQVLDDYGDKYKTLQPWQYTGSVYSVQAPAKRVTKHANEWQKMEITCVGPSVKIVINDVEINNVNLIDYMEKVKDHPGIIRRKGYIGFQNHSTKIEYRNIHLKEL